MRIPAALASSSWLPLPLRYGWTLAGKAAVQAAPTLPAVPARGVERSRHSRNEKRRRVPDHRGFSKRRKCFFWYIQVYKSVYNLNMWLYDDMVYMFIVNILNYNMHMFA